jgi:hypothetical protein
MITTIPDRERALQAQVDALTEELERVEASNRIRGDELARLRAQEPIGHVHSDGDFCWDKQVNPASWPIKVYAAPPAQPAEPVQWLSDVWLPDLVADASIAVDLAADPIKLMAFTRRIVAAIESAIQPQWRDIESAPKDFVTVFDGWNGERVPNVSWGHPTYSPKGAFDWCAEEYEQHFGYVTVAVKGLTHWMPIPPAPKASHDPR